MLPTYRTNEDTKLKLLSKNWQQKLFRLLRKMRVGKSFNCCKMKTLLLETCRNLKQCGWKIDGKIDHKLL